MWLVSVVDSISFQLRIAHLPISGGGFVGGVAGGAGFARDMGGRLLEADVGEEARLYLDDLVGDDPGPGLGVLVGGGALVAFGGREGVKFI